MQRGINGMALVPADLFTCIDVVADVGYDVLEVWAPMVTAYLAQGGTTEELAAKLKHRSLRPHSIVAVENIDLPEGPERRQLIGYCRNLCMVAKAIGCHNVEMVSGKTWAGSPWSLIRTETARGLREMANVAAEYGLTVVYEPLAWLPVSRVWQTMEVIGEAGCANVGILVDTFHVFAAGDNLDTIRKIDLKLLPTVHLGDTATVPKRHYVWSDDDRGTMAGDGVAPLQEIMKAILATGYDGVVTDEISPTAYSTWERMRLARTIKSKGDAALASLRC